jgi:hypothetical protein
MGREAKIEKAVVAYAREKGCYVRKFKSPGQRAVPDRIFITPQGVVFFIEFKAEGEEPTALQFRELNLIQEHTTSADWVDNIKQGKAMVDYFMVKD